jgi:hypothetical protein
MAKVWRGRWWGIAGLFDSPGRETYVNVNRNAEF